MLKLTLIEALTSLAANRMRSGLTMLGMIIGVGSVIMMLAIGSGVQSTVNESIAAMGSNLFIVTSGAPTQSGVRLGMGGTPTLKMGDARAIAELPTVAAVAPMFPGGGQLATKDANWNTQITGTTPSFFDVRDWKVKSGALFSDSDVTGATQVVVLGSEVANQLFKSADPLGEVVRIKGAPFAVVGVLSSKGQSMDGRNQDDTVFIPVTTAQRKLFGTSFPDSVRFMLVSSASLNNMPKAETQMKDLLRQRHRIGPGADDDFAVNNMTAVAEQAAATVKTMALLLGAIASISLVVGGIGIMNIMLVSVAERTREIGIRMAIGARPNAILEQFLAEAIVLSLAGGLVGMLLGIGGAIAFALISGTTVVVSGQAALMAATISVSVGIFFGWYPAWKASCLLPIEALRRD